MRLNRPKYETLWKRSTTGVVRPYKVEIKLERLYCYLCHDYQPLSYFPTESGYGSEVTRPVCKLHLKDEDKGEKLPRKTVVEQAFEHYGGKCVVCGLSDLRMLKLYHKQGEAVGNQCKIDACGFSNRYHLKSYCYWLKKHHYPKQHQQVVLCLCHYIIQNRHIPLCSTKKSRKAKQVRKKHTQHRRVALTDKDKLLEMFGLDLLDDD